MDLIEKAELVAFGYRGAVNARVSREDDVVILTWPKGLGHIEIRIKDEAFVVTIRGLDGGWMTNRPSRLGLLIGSVDRQMHRLAETI